VHVQRKIMALSRNQCCHRNTVTYSECVL